MSNENHIVAESGCDHCSELSEKAIARQSEPYFAPWRKALRDWVNSGCPNDCKVIRKSTYPLRCLLPPVGTVVLCAFCKNEEYFHGYPACLDCPYNNANDGIFLDLAEFFKDLELNNTDLKYERKNYHEENY